MKLRLHTLLVLMKKDIHMMFSNKNHHSDFAASGLLCLVSIHVCGCDAKGRNGGLYPASV